MQIIFYLLISVVVINSKVINKITCNGNACGSDVVSVRTYITCPPGYVNKNNKVCIRNTENTIEEFTIECPENYELRGNQCISDDLQRCPTGYSLENDMCVKKACPFGYKLNLSEKECIYDSSVCPQNFILNDGKCIPLCPYAYKLSDDGANCVYDVKTCPQNYVFNGKQCLRRCPFGFNLNIDIGICVAV